MLSEARENDMDWSHCPDAQHDPSKVSGVWVVKGSRVPVQAIIDNARDGFSPEAIAEMFEGLPVERIRGVLRFAGLNVSHPV
jgi:uncharacterized protein (DUF433 family)